MIVLLDTGPTQRRIAPDELGPSVKVGQLISPLTGYANPGLRWGMDNGFFSKIDPEGFMRKLKQQKPYRDACIFVNAPDCVGNARRTLELFSHWYPKLSGWPIAFTAQNGIEDLEIPWRLIDCLFLGGTEGDNGRTDWKLSRAAADVVTTAKAMSKWVHIGRVNTPERFDKFLHLGADSVDGSGISKHSWMRKRLAEGVPLFESKAGAA